MIDGHMRDAESAQEAVRRAQRAWSTEVVQGAV